MPIRYIMLATALLVGVIIWSGAMHQVNPSKTFKDAFAAAIIVPVLSYFLGFWPSKDPLKSAFLVDITGIKAQTLFSETYVRWYEVAKVEHVWTNLGRGLNGLGIGVGRIQNHLIMHKKDGSSKRLLMPTLSLAEKEQFFIILQNISKHHGFEVIIH